MPDAADASLGSSTDVAHPKSSGETVMPPTAPKKPDEFAQQKLMDMKATTWTPRVNAHVPKSSGPTAPSVHTPPVTHGMNAAQMAQMAQELAAMGWICTQPPQPAAKAVETPPPKAEAAKAAPPPPKAAVEAPMAAPPKAVETPTPPAKAAAVEAPMAAPPKAVETPPSPKAAVEAPKAVPAPPKALQPPAPKAVEPAPSAVQPPPPNHMSPPPKVSMGPPPPPMQIKQEPLTQQALQAHARANGLQKEQDKQYTRRAAANLIQRLRENPSRTQGMPALAQMVNDEGKKSDLISLLVTNDGSFEKVGLHL